MRFCGGIKKVSKTFPPKIKKSIFCVQDFPFYVGKIYEKMTLKTEFFNVKNVKHIQYPNVFLIKNEVKIVKNRGNFMFYPLKIPYFE